MCTFLFVPLALACAVAATRGEDRPVQPDPAQLAAIGRMAFFDPALSATGRQSCASCHDPAHAFAPPNRLAVQLGGADGVTQGTRATPSLQYLRGAEPFVERKFGDSDGGDADDAAPTGGLMWDGRVDTLAEQAKLPLFNPREMANADAATLAAHLRNSSFADAFRQAFSAPGHDVFDSPEQTVQWLGAALEAYQRSAPEFAPFTSKYDAFLRKEVELSPQERRGLALYDDPEKGNCASCHPNAVSPRGAFPTFTDFGHVAVGVPRNRTLEVNRDPAYHDLGLCGPERGDLVRHDEFCGAFLTPTLRNVATRGAFFHNGVFHSLREVLEFYVQRDTDPARWYGRNPDGSARRYDDLPAAYAANVDDDVPFKPDAQGRPRLDAREIDDLIVYLETLTDGYVVPREQHASAE